MLKKIAAITLIISIVCMPCYAQTAVTPAVSKVQDPLPDSDKSDAIKSGNITVNFKDADIRAVLNYLSEVSGVDIVPAPDVTGAVTLKLTDKPWQTALDLIVRNYGLAYEKEGDIIRVASIDSLRLEELTTEVVKLNYADAAEILDSVKDMLTERGRITADGRTNTVVITDVPANIYQVKQIMRELDRRTPQIMIEAKIIETELEKAENMGIDWNLRIAISGASRPTTLPFDSMAADWGLKSEVIRRYFPTGTTGGMTTTIGSGGATETTAPGDYPASTALSEDAATRAFPFVDTSAFTYGTLDFSQFSAIIDYLKQRRNTQIVSNPRITTLNNKEAKIFVGRVYYYLSKLEKDEETKDITYEYKEKEIGVRLLVTPSVNEDGEIVVKLKPEIKHIVGFQQLTNDFTLPIFSTREAETEVMIRHGDTIFIGGLIKDDLTSGVKKFPVLGDLLGDVPFIGHAFKYETEQKTKTELVFFITVYIVNDVKELTNMIKRRSNTPEIFVQVGEPYVDRALPIKKQDQPAAATGDDSKAWLDFRKKRD
ncbi:MAG: secretin N-terminal domain-containing protein [Candidatus Omnitrophota bacterium]